MAEKGDSPIITLKRHIDKQGLRNQQLFLLVIAALVLGIGAMAARNIGPTAIYTILALGGGVCFVLFTLIYGLLVKSKLKNTRYCVFHNRIEYQKDGKPQQIIPLSEITEINEERTPWQLNEGLTSVILAVRPESILSNEQGIDYYVLADIESDEQPSDIIYDTIQDYRAKSAPKK